MNLKFLLNEYSDPNDGRDWDEQEPQIIECIRKSVETFPGGGVEYEIEELDIGTGADWPMILLTVLSLAGGGFFGIPSVHKKIRESIAEWRLIWTKLDHLSKWLKDRHLIMAYPVDMMFLDALHSLDQIAEADDAVVLDVAEVPRSAGEDYDPDRPFPYHLFTFRVDETLYVYAYDEKRRLLWSREIEI